MENEQVRCFFKGTDLKQGCFTATSNPALNFSCEGIYNCTVNVKGPIGTQLTWKNSCGESRLPVTTIDGTNESVNFLCSISSTPVPVPVPILPTLTVSLSESSPLSSTLSAPQSDITFAVINLKAGDMPVTNLNGIQVASDSFKAPSRVTNIRVYDGATLLGIAPSLITNGSYYYQWINVSGVSIPANTTKQLKLVADVPYAIAGTVRLGIAGLNFDSPGAYSDGMPAYGSNMNLILSTVVDANDYSNYDSITASVWDSLQIVLANWIPL